MSTLTCPHCQATNEPTASFCEKCGKALPSAQPTGPRVVSGEDVAATATGRGLQMQQLRKKARNASAALFLVAVLNAVFCAIIHGTMRGPEYDQEAVRMLLLTNLGLTVAYAALGAWALFSPLPAALVGLVLFISVLVLNAVLDPSTIPQGIIVKIIVIAVLLKSVHAAILYRQIQAQSPADVERAP